MSLKKSSRRSHGMMNELNITPLLDLVFVLLVIFIITTPQLVNNLEINLPSGKTPPKANEPPKINRIEISAQGQITLNAEAVTVPQLKDKLAAIKTDDPDPKVIVKGADEVDYQVMVNVIDVLHQLDIIKMGMATE